MSTSRPAAEAAHTTTRLGPPARNQPAKTNTAPAVNNNKQPQPQPPRRDWRDWFIMATVVTGVGYSLYSLGKVTSNLLSRQDR